jgi:hypothetical protein
LRLPDCRVELEIHDDKGEFEIPNDMIEIELKILDDRVKKKMRFLYWMVEPEISNDIIELEIPDDKVKFEIS